VAEPRARLPGGGTHAHCKPDKSILARLGIRNFKPTLRKAAERLASVHTPEGMSMKMCILAPGLLGLESQYLDLWLLIGNRSALFCHFGPLLNRQARDWAYGASSAIEQSSPRPRPSLLQRAGRSAGQSALSGTAQLTGMPQARGMENCQRRRLSRVAPTRNRLRGFGLRPNRF
jgi:hypothetical protein